MNLRRLIVCGLLLAGAAVSAEEPARRGPLSPTEEATAFRLADEQLTVELVAAANRQPGGNRLGRRRANVRRRDERLFDGPRLSPAPNAGSYTIFRPRQAWPCQPGKWTLDDQQASRFVRVQPAARPRLAPPLAGVSC